MSIQYTEIPENLRSPGIYIEFDARGAGRSPQTFTALLMGLKNAEAPAALNRVYDLTRASQAKELFGGNSLLHLMAYHWFIQEPRGVELKAVALAEPEGRAASHTLTFRQLPRENEEATLHIGHRSIAFPLNPESAEACANALKDALERRGIPFNVTKPGSSSVRLTAKHKGTFFNKLQVGGDAILAPLLQTVTVSGQGSVNLAPLWSQLGDEWIHYFICPFKEPAVLESLTEELTSRFSAQRQIGGRAFLAVGGTHGNLSTLGNAQNSPHLAILGLKNGMLEGEVAAAFGAQCASSLVKNPAKPLHGLKLNRVIAPAMPFTGTEREVLLFDGISTYKVSPAHEVHLDKIITTYQRNAGGVAHTAYLALNTPETLERIRTEQRHLFLRKFPNALLRGDQDPVSPGLVALSPQKAKGELLVLYQQMIEKGWVEDLNAYKQSLRVERDTANPNRLNVADSPNLVNQFEILAVRTNFQL